MKRYPSIARRLKGKRRERLVHVFDKLDGSNLRFEWETKNGWVRWGSRNRVIDESHPILGQGWALFARQLRQPLEAVAHTEGWQGMVVFAEFFGPHSLGGQHAEDDEKELVMFDVAPHKKGLLGPVRFLELFGELNTPRYLGEHLWNEEFVSRVRRGELPGVTSEGVIGKAGDGHSIVMAKAKSQTWIDKILARYGQEEGQKLIDS